MTKAVDILVDDVYERGGRHCRVLGIIGGRVAYSTGSDRNRSCKIETFRGWIRNQYCQRTFRKPAP